MLKTKLSFTLATCLFSATALLSQASADQPGSASENKDKEMLEINGTNWTFYLDMEDRKCYIDFETISVNLTEIQVTNESGTLVLKDDVMDLPVNAIYELDMKEWHPGKYNVELKTYTGVIRKELEIGN